VTAKSKGGHAMLAGVQHARGIAAILVVFYHAAAQMAIDPAYGRFPHLALEYGSVGVPIFFVISGFIISIVSLDREFKPKVTLRRFAEKRLVRILPFMWLAIIAYNILSLLGTGKIEWGPFLRAMTLWPSGSVKPNVIWTLRHEAIFYGLFALSFLLPRRHLWIISAWCLVPLITGLLLGHTPLPPESSGEQRLLGILFADANMMLGSGLLMGLAFIARPNAFKRNLPGGAAAVYLSAVLVVLFSWKFELKFGFRASVGVLILSVILMYYAIRLAPRFSKADRLSSFLGDASYSIYLTHNTVIVPGLIIGRQLVPYLGLWGSYLGIVLIAIVAGILSHLFIERPVIALIGQRLASDARPLVRADEREA
jgi:exopolysaccharide production protein ExoZ